jgi:hypothetical protein
VLVNNDATDTEGPKDTRTIGKEWSTGPRSNRALLLLRWDYGRVFADVLKERKASLVLLPVSRSAAAAAWRLRHEKLADFLR